MSSYHLKVDPDNREITVHMAVMDIYAGLRQSARIAREEGFPITAERCEEYASLLNTARAFQQGTYDDSQEAGKKFYTITIKTD